MTEGALSSTVPAGRGGRRSPTSPFVWVALAVALLPFVIAAVKLIVDVGGAYYPQADYAALEARTRDVTHHPVLTGLYSREGWSHPGPVLFYLMAIPYWLTGQSSMALPVTALLINGASIAGMALLARRRGGMPVFVVTLLLGGLVVRALGFDFMADPWNPFITVLPFGVLLFLCWAMLCGERWALPIGVAIASFCAQTHIGYVPLALPLVAVGAFGLVVAARRDGVRRQGAAPARALAAPFAAAAAVLAVLWAPPLIEQLTNHPGNITEVVRYFTGSADQGHSIAQGLRVVGGQYGLPPEWLSGARPSNLFTSEHAFVFEAPWPLLLVVVALAVTVLYRRRVGAALRLATVVGVASVLGVVSIWRTTGPLYAYRLRWTWVLAAAAAVVVGWAAWVLVSRARRPPRRWLAPAALVALVAVSVLNGAGAVHVDPPHLQASSVLGEIVPSVLDALPEGDGPVVIDSMSPPGSEYAGGLVLALERRGVAAQVEGFDERGWGRHRVYREGPLHARLTVAVNEDIDARQREAGVRRIAYWGMADDERVRRVRRLAGLDAAHQAGELPPGALALRRAETLPAYSAVAVFIAVDGSGGGAGRPGGSGRSQ